MRTHELKKEVERLRELLSEARDWLCPHTEAAQLFRTTDIGRSWCCDCHNYVRSEDDCSLIERIDATLAHTPREPDAESPPKESKTCEHPDRYRAMKGLSFAPGGICGICKEIVPLNSPQCSIREGVCEHGTHAKYFCDDCEEECK
jgi:hypothetical protein